MDKQQIISFITEQVREGKITKADLFAITDGGVPASEVKEHASKNLITTFYSIGTIIALIGVSILVGQHWDEIGFIGRILVSLGISLVTYVSALLLTKPSQNTLSQVMFTISAALAPLGVYVMLKEANIVMDTSVQIATALSLTFIYGVAFWISRKNVLVLLSIGFATWAYFAGLKNFLDYNFTSDLTKWASMLLGFSYILVGYGYYKAVLPVDDTDKKQKNSVRGILYALGTFAILLAGISVGDYFDIIFIAFIFAAFYGSVFLKSRGMLILGALFLVAHIIKLTSKYFVGSIGWPIALIGVGFLVIGVGYFTFYLNKRFLRTVNN